MSETDPEYSALLRRAAAADAAGEPTGDLIEQLHARYLDLARGGVTAGGLPYPSPTDPFAEGADAIRALAEAMNPYIAVGPWVDLSEHLASGMSAAGVIRARRVGRMVDMQLNSFTVASMSVPVNGNVTNVDILTDIPTEFWPSTDAGVVPGGTGRIWAGVVTPAGSVVFASVVPTATMTATDTWTNQTYAGIATYLAATEEEVASQHRLSDQ